MTKELKPCPFCGERARIIELPHNDPSARWMVDCANRDGCEVGPFLWRKSKAEAVRAWNNRAERTCEAKLCCDGFYRCTECEHSMLPSDNYCSNCGAKVVDA